MWCLVRIKDGEPLGWAIADEKEKLCDPMRLGGLADTLIPLIRQSTNEPKQELTSGFWLLRDVE